MTTCILLAGGLGTRLRPAVPDLPKCLAPVAGTPFLDLQMRRLASQGVERFILSLGYRADQVLDATRRWRRPYEMRWVVEPEPLGTGGAALLAMELGALSEALIANADTWVRADLAPLFEPLAHGSGEHMRLIAVRSEGGGRGGRFGQLVVKDGKAERFLPRGSPVPGPINAGLYRMRLDGFAGFRAGQAFSLEGDVIPPLARRGAVAAAVVSGTVVDIGVPEDYLRFCAQFEAA